MNFDPIFLAIMQGGGFSGVLIAAALLYLSLQVKSLQKSVDSVQKTIADQVLPRLDNHTREISLMQGRLKGTIE